MFFLFVVGPTVFIMGTFTESLGGYLTHLPAMAFRTGAFGGADWVNGWTVFYWAWWISWTPFVGMFIARISKGRTIRQFVIYVVLVPEPGVVRVVLDHGRLGVRPAVQPGCGPRRVVNSDGGTERVLFETLREYPLASITVVLAVFLIAIFFITGADSASIVMGMLSQHGTEHPKRWLVVFWGVAQGAVASVLLWSGGLSALQTLVIIVAGPFMLIIVAMCFSLMKALRAEPYESTLPSRVRRAVLHAQRARPRGAPDRGARRARRRRARDHHPRSSPQAPNSTPTRQFEPVRPQVAVGSICHFPKSSSWVLHAGVASGAGQAAYKTAVSSSRDGVVSDIVAHQASCWRG